MLAWISVSPGRVSLMESISTPTPWGTSSRRFHSAFSRMISAQSTRSGWSVIMSSGKYFGPSGMAETSMESTLVILSPRRAETQTIWSNARSLSFCSCGISVFRLAQVDLVDGEELGQAIFATSSRIARSPAPMNCPSTTHSTRVHALAGVVGGLDHVLAELGARLVQARVSTKTICQSARVATPSRRERVVWGWLETMGHLFPHKAVHDAGLAHVGAAEDGTKPERKGCLFSIAVLLYAEVFRAEGMGQNVREGNDVEPLPVLAADDAHTSENSLSTCRQMPHGHRCALEPTHGDGGEAARTLHHGAADGGTLGADVAP